MSDKVKEKIRFGPGNTAVHRDAEGNERHIRYEPAKEGEPLKPGADLMSVSNECRDGWHDVEVLYRSGPAQVATPAYREGYDRIFGKKAEVGLA